MTLQTCLFLEYVQVCSVVKLTRRPMSPSAKPRAGSDGAAAPTESVRDRILSTARDLFYKEGARAVTERRAPVFGQHPTPERPTAK